MAARRAVQAVGRKKIMAHRTRADIRAATRRLRARQPNAPLRLASPLAPGSATLIRNECGITLSRRRRWERETIGHFFGGFAFNSHPGGKLYGSPIIPRYACSCCVVRIASILLARRFIRSA